MSYILPQVQVFQEFRVLPTAVIENLNAFVFGANYQLYRYGVASEKAEIGLGAYNKDADVAYAYPMQPTGSSVDLAYVKLYMDNVWAEYLQISSSDVNPLVVKSDTERNKLRAMPVIGDVLPTMDDVTPVVGVNMQMAGCYNRGAVLPENYYFFPVGGWTGSAWEASGFQSAIATQDAKLRYITSENLSGYVDVRATDAPLTLGNYVAGPHGLQLDLDTGIGDTFRAPLIVTFGTAGTQSFTLTVDMSRIKTLIDWAVDDKLPIKINVDLTSATSAVTWSGLTNTLTITGDTSYDIRDLYDDLAGNSDVAAYFDLSAAPLGGEDVTTAVYQGNVSVDTGLDVLMLRDAYRVVIAPNPYTFATGNGTAATSQFKSRGVRVGDRIRYQVTGVDAVTHTGVSRVVGFEAEEVAASIGMPFNKESNAADQTATNLISGADILVAADDNQRQMDGLNTVIRALDSSKPKYPGSLFSGVIADSYTVTVTVAGAKGTARATVRNASGTYYRENVLIENAGSDDGRLYIGDNLYINFDKGSGDADALFKVGDTYTFNANILADFDAPDSTVVESAGTYAGYSDTTYIVEVVRGGVFDRIVNVTPGLQTPNTVVLTYTGRPSDTNTITIDGVVFEIDDTGAVTSGNVAVDVSGSSSDDADYAILASVINTTLPYVNATLNTTAGTLTIAGTSTVVSGVAEALDNATLAAATAVDLTAAINWDDWTGGDVNDEYVLTCTQGGALALARFAVTSQRGDNQTGIKFGAVATSKALGTRGLTAQFDTDVTFAVGQSWVIRVNAARPQVRVSDSAGVDNGGYIVVDNSEPVALGSYGATVTFAANLNIEGGFATGGGLRKGDVYFVPAYAPSEGALNTLVLADDLPTVIPGITGTASNPEPDLFGAWLYLVQNSAQIDTKRLWSPGDYNWEAAAGEVTVNRQIAVQDATWVDNNGSLPYLPVYSGDMFVEYRALLPAYTTTIASIADIADVATTFGTIDPDNPLAQGVYNALSNSGGQPVYYMAVPTDDHDGFLRVLDRASLNGKIYGFAPLTQDREIINSVEAHINALSTEENKRWRIGLVGTAMPTSASVYDKSKNPAGQEYFVRVSDDPSKAGTQYTLVSFVTAAGDPSPYTEILDDVRVGDKLRVNFAVDPWNNSTYEEYTVASLVSNTVLRLTTGLPAPITVPTKAEVWHNFNVQEMADAVAAISSGFANRRMYHVFPSILGAFGVQQTSEFAAAAVAGLISSVPPQQGLTNIELNGFDDLPMVYSTFNRTQLNWMAENGTMIIMQDVAGGEIYIRHQVSTNTKSGDLNQTELSVTKNLDSISYYFAERLAPFIGRFNITPELLTVLHTQIKDGLMFLGSFTSVGLLGPQIILTGDPARGITGTTIERVEQHPTLLDHVVAIVNIRLPYPLNVIELHLVV